MCFANGLTQAHKHAIIVGTEVEMHVSGNSKIELNFVPWYNFSLTDFVLEQFLVGQISS